MSEIQVASRKIENLREQLHLTIKGRALTDPLVLLMSQRLDQALNEYSGIVTNRQHKKG